MIRPSREAHDLAVRTPLAAWEIEALMHAQHATVAEVEQAIELSQAHRSSPWDELQRVMGKAATR